MTPVAPHCQLIFNYGPPAVFGPFLCTQPASAVNRLVLRGGVAGPGALPVRKRNAIAGADECL